VSDKSQERTTIYYVLPIKISKSNKYTNNTELEWKQITLQSKVSHKLAGAFPVKYLLRRVTW